MKETAKVKEAFMRDGKRWTALALAATLAAAAGASWAGPWGKKPKEAEKPGPAMAQKEPEKPKEMKAAEKPGKNKHKKKTSKKKAAPKDKKGAPEY